MIYSKAKTNLFLSLTIAIGILCVLIVFSHPAKSAPHPVSSPPELIWRPTSSLRSTLARFPMVICDVEGLGEVIYVVGGVKEVRSGEWILSDSVQHATLEPDGGISTWQQQSFTEMELYGAATIAYEGRVYVIGGGQGSLSKKEVYYAQPTSTGDIIGWTSTSFLTIALNNHAAVELDGRIYVIGGFNETRPGDPDFSNKVYSSTIQPDGSLLPWQKETESLVDYYTRAPYGVGAHAAVATHHPKKAIYVFGGDHNRVAQKAVYRAFVNSGGALGEWKHIDDLPLPAGASGLRYHSVVLVGDKIFIIGGEITDGGGKSSSDQIYVATISGTGDLTWTHTYTLPAPREQLASVAASNGAIYVAGGRKRDGNNKYYYDNVWVAPPVLFTKSHNPRSEVTYGDTITYTVTYTNNGLRDLSGVFVTDTVPLNTRLLAISSRPITEPILWVRNGVTVTVDGINAGSTITWDFGTLPITSSGQVSFVVQVVPPEVTALSRGAQPLTGNLTGRQAVLPDWFAASRMNAPQIAAGRQHRADAEMTYAGQNLAMGDNSSRHTSTSWPNSMLSRTYQNTGSNLVSVASPIPMPVTPATHTTWTQTCALTHLEVLGKGMSDTLTATLTIPNPDSIVSDSMRIQVALKISPGGEASQIAEVILSTGGSDFRLATPTSVDDFMAVYELDVPVSEAVTVTVMPIGDVMTRTDSLIAYVWRTATEGRGTGGWTDNKAVYWDGPRPGYSRTLSLPPLTESGNVTVQVTVADNDPDHNERVLYLEAEAGGVTATKTITTPSHGNYLDIHSIVLTDVPTGTTEVTITVASPPNTGDSLGLLGAVAEAACQPTPAVLGVHPDTLCDDVENEITIEGTDFVPTPQVQLGDTELLDITFVSPNTLTAAVPSGMAQGIYSLTVTNPGVGDLSGTLPNAVTVLHGPITVTDFQPKWGLNTVTTVVTITGSNFRRTLTVSLGSTPLSILWKSDNQLEAIIPPGIAPGYYTFTVVNPPPCDREDSTEATFLVVDDSPVIITNVACLCSDQTGCVPSNPVMNTPYRVYLPIVMKSYATP